MGPLSQKHISNPDFGNKVLKEKGGDVIYTERKGGRRYIY